MIMMIAMVIDFVEFQHFRFSTSIAWYRVYRLSVTPFLSTLIISLGFAFLPTTDSTDIPTRAAKRAWPVLRAPNE